MSDSQLLDKLNNVKQHGNVYRAACPICDKSKSDDALVIFDNGGCYCHRCHATIKEISAHFGGNLFRPNSSRPAPILKPTNPTEWNHQRDKHIECLYDFETVEGVRVQHVRFPKSDKYSKWSWRHQIQGKWYNGIGGNTCYLFNRQAIKNAAVVFFVEGEKDAQRLTFELAAHGFTDGFAVTTHHAGAGGKLKTHQLEQLRDKFVYLIGDNDNAGRKGVYQKWSTVADIASGAKWLALPYIKSDDGSDLSDLFDNGYTVVQLLIDADLAVAKEDDSQLFESENKHTCGRDGLGFTANVRYNETELYKWQSQKWRVCDACMVSRVARAVRQIRAEMNAHGDFHSIELSASDWKKRSAAWRQKARRSNGTLYISWQAVPQESGNVILINNQGLGEKLPTDKLELKALVNGWYSGQSLTGRIRSSKNFGGDFQGTKGNQSETARHRRKIERDHLLEQASNLVSNFTPDKPASNGTVKEVRNKLSGLITHDETLAIIQAELSGKNRISIIKSALLALNAIDRDDPRVSIQIFGYGRDKVADALGIKSADSIGTAEINGLDAVQIIQDAATSSFVRGGQNAFNVAINTWIDSDIDENVTLKEYRENPISLKRDILLIQPTLTPDLVPEEANYSYESVSM